MEEKNIMDCKAEGMPMPEAPKVQKLDLGEVVIGDVPDEVILIPVSEYKHLIRCEATVNLMDKLLDNYGEYSSERAKIMAVACQICGKEVNPLDA